MGAKPQSLSMIARTARQPRRSAGLALLEIMISVFVIGLAVLGTLKMQATALRSSHVSRLQAIESNLAQELIDNINAAGPATPLNLWSIDFQRPTGGSAYINQWKAKVTARLPEGDAQVSCDGGSRICTITIRWKERQGDAVQNRSYDARA